MRTPATASPYLRDEDLIVERIIQAQEARRISPTTARLLLRIALKRDAKREVATLTHWISAHKREYQALFADIRSRSRYV